MHRLDRDVSGLMVLGKHTKACSIKMELKEYIGLVKGKPIIDKGPIVANLLEDNKIQIIHENGQYAKTVYKTLKSSLFHIDNYSLIRFLLDTGRKHQIRAHTTHFLKCPLIGDYKYGFQDDKFLDEKRIFLHSFMVDVKNMRLKADIPQDFKDLQERLDLIDD